MIACTDSQTAICIFAGFPRPVTSAQAANLIFPTCEQNLGIGSVGSENVAKDTSSTNYFLHGT